MTPRGNLSPIIREWKGLNPGRDNYPTDDDILTELRFHASVTIHARQDKPLAPCQRPFCLVCGPDAPPGLTVLALIEGEAHA